MICKASREGSSGKQTALILFCEARRFEFLHAKWIPWKVGFKTYRWTPAKRASLSKKLEMFLAVREVKFQGVSQNMNPLCQPAFGSVPSERTPRDEL